MDECTTLYMTQLAAEGLDQTAIAEKLGVHPATVSRNMSKETIKAKIEYCKALIVEKAYEASVNNIVDVIENYKSKVADKDDKDGLMRREHGFKASLRVAESMGLIESRSQAGFTANVLIQNNTQNIISPLVDKALSHALMIPDATICSSESDE